LDNPFDVPARGPLYIEVRQKIISRISTGAWAPGEMLPSEHALGTEFGVSQGTVRKALDDLSQRNMVVRRQGKGTFVAAHTRERALFHFFHIVAEDGSRELPTRSRVLSCRRHKANSHEAQALNLDKTDRVIEIQRVRDMDGIAAISETVVVPVDLFPDLDKRTVADVPNELYQLYEERYGITVQRAVERLRAIAATKLDASRLSIAPGTPLLEIERIAETLNGQPVELRTSRCLTAGRHYVSTIV
jgi:GntR family transcriptional regulator